MEIIISFNVPELDDECRKGLMDRLDKECKRLSINQARIIDNVSSKAIDVNISRVHPAGVAELIHFVKAVLRNTLNLNA